MHVIFFGTAAFAVPSLEALVADGHRVVLCVTQPDRARGRGLRVEASPVKQAAVKHGLPLAQPEHLTADLVEGLTPEVGVVAAYGKLLPGALVQAPAHGMLGVHPSLLPKYRGAAPVAWALLAGEAVTGVTIFRLTEQLDAGEIIAQRTVPIEAEETAEGLTARLASVGARELAQSLRALASGRVDGRAQREADASLAPKLTKAQGRMNWQQPAVELERLVRATIPWPGASTVWHGTPLKVLAASVRATAGAPATGVRHAPGTVIGATSDDGLVVATGDGSLVITEVQPAGKRRMSVREFLAGHPVQPGERLGDDA